MAPLDMGIAVAMNMTFWRRNDGSFLCSSLIYFKITFLFCMCECTDIPRQMNLYIYTTASDLHVPSEGQVITSGFLELHSGHQPWRQRSLPEETSL